MTTTMNTLERAAGSATPPAAGSISSAGASALAETPVPIEEMAVALMERAREQGVALVGPGGLLQGLAKDGDRVGVGGRADRARRLRAV